MKAKFYFTITLKGNDETLPTPPITLEAIEPEAFTVTGVNVYQEVLDGEVILVKQIEVKND